MRADLVQAAVKGIGRWMANLVAVVAGLIALFAINAWRQTAWLPYNTEGRYFDAETSIVYTDAEPLSWAMVGFAALALGVGASVVGWKLRRR
ncbi:MAG TPA: hypothetical protein VM753_05825 [Anaeromyxobacter sp.]|jgi:hypothetical protein|nr:hypothetical protein [Anaeromyxobacter sp.]